MASWVLPTIWGGIFAAVVGFGTFGAYEQGRQAETLQALRDDISALSAKVDRGFRDVSTQVSSLEVAVRSEEADISKILVGMGLVTKEDVYKAAVIDGWIWLFPSPELSALVDARGLKIEQVNPYVSGIRVIEASVLYDD